MKLENLTDSFEHPLISEPASPFRPNYRGLEWIEADLPMTHRPWIPRKPGLVVVPTTTYASEVSHAELKKYVAEKPWVWPDREIHFLCDLHADADAFLTSLVASGGIARTGAGDLDFDITEEGRKALFIIGGDCVDKGPSNLRLLRLVKGFMDKGADIVILAGNHDLRLFVGLFHAFSRNDPRLAHLFARLGRKAVPLFREVLDAYEDHPRKRRVTDAQARKALFPDESWYDAFPDTVKDILSEASIAKETRRIRQKTVEMEERAREMGMTLGQVKAAVDKCREIFLSPNGDFAWLFQRMRLAYRAGSFLFVHAGIDDIVAGTLKSHGIEGLNGQFRDLLRTDPFTLYNGPVGNVFRTKYRNDSLPLTEQGVQDMRNSGIYAIIHGHRNILRGQRMIIRSGILNIECDASVDRNTREAEGLSGPGGAVTTFRLDGRLLGISTDCPYIKHFDPTEFSAAPVMVAATE